MKKGGLIMANNNISNKTLEVNLNKFCQDNFGAQSMDRHTFKSIKCYVEHEFGGFKNLIAEDIPEEATEDEIIELFMSIIQDTDFIKRAIDYEKNYRILHKIARILHKPVDDPQVEDIAQDALISILKYERKHNNHYYNEVEMYRIQKTIIDRRVIDHNRKLGKDTGEKDENGNTIYEKPEVLGNDDFSIEESEDMSNLDIESNTLSKAYINEIMIELVRWTIEDEKKHIEYALSYIDYINRYGANYCKNVDKSESLSSYGNLIFKDAIDKLNSSLNNYDVEISCLADLKSNYADDYMFNSPSMGSFRTYIRKATNYLRKHFSY